MEKWTVRNIKFNVNKLANEVEVSPVVAKLLVNRGIYEKEEAKRFLNPNLDHLLDPMNLLDLNVAIDLMKESIKLGEKILIVGDYDVDGVISTFILYKALKRCNANVTYHIPDRIKEGYGINESIIIKASEEGINTIITCDNGISAIEQIKLAKKLGLKVVITDHHDVPFIEKESGEREFIWTKSIV